MALPGVPLAWRDGFLQRNPGNLALASAATRLGADLDPPPRGLPGLLPEG